MERNFSEQEKKLHEMGHCELSDLIRSTRLENPYPVKTPQWHLWNDQCKCNIALLIHASLYLKDFCERQNKQRILFTSRDGCLWIKVFRQLFKEFDAIYFHASRIAYRTPSASYIEYVKSVYTDKTVIVDVLGSGESAYAFFTTHLQIEPLYLAIINSGKRHHGIIRSIEASATIEMLNYDACGVFVDVGHREPLEYPLQYIEPMHACIDRCVEFLPSFSIEPFDANVLRYSLEWMSDLSIHQFIVPKVTGENRAVRSFSFFNTLAARLHYNSEGLFQRIEESFPFPGFTFFRMMAEGKSNRTLTDIYKQFQAVAAVPEKTAEALMQYEFAMEQKELFPIVENVAKVEDHDLIVTDTHYDTRHIRTLADQFLIPQSVCIYAHPKGKSSGMGWAFLKKNYTIEKHLGDSYNRDVAGPRLQNIEAIHYTEWELTPEEDQFLKRGQREMSFLCRALRLSNPYAPKSASWLLWNDQCRLCVPILLHASLYLDAFCKARQKKKILFTARDSCHWIQLFRSLFPTYDSIYFHTSRTMYRSPSASFIEYVQTQYSDDAVIVDVHGTGYSACKFFQDYLNKKPTYLAIVNPSDSRNAILREECESLEMLNYDLCGALLDVKGGIAERLDMEYPLEYVAPMHACIKKCLEFLPHFRIEAFDREIIAFAVQSIREALTIRGLLFHEHEHTNNYRTFVKSVDLLPKASAEKQRVRSFDLFDTLLGRFHYDPASIFTLVEKLYPFAGFTFFRIAAACKSDHTLKDIYRCFQELTQITEAEAFNLMQFEMETELAHIFPIFENLNQVNDEDLIVSDTYYTKEQVQKILEKLKLSKSVQIYASPYGKSSGAAWRFLKEYKCIESHLGDCFHADVKMATLHGIEAIHYTNSRLSKEEEHLFHLGQKNLSFLCRALRLSNPYLPQTGEWQLWNDQCKYNVPTLIHASLHLQIFCEANKKRRILFTSRDCCLWIQIFRTLFPSYDSIYFHSSRHTFINPTSSYIAYVQSLYTEHSLIADVQGTGFSAEQFFLEHSQIPLVYVAIVSHRIDHHAMVRKNRAFEPIEMLNYDTCGTLYDVQNGKPLRAPIEYPLKYIEPMHRCIKKCLEFLPFYTIEPFDQAVLEWAVQSMESNLAICNYVAHAKRHCHIADGAALQHLHITHPELII